MKYPKFVDNNNICCESFGFSNTQYRFKLTIPFLTHNGKGYVCVIMKNPSTANEENCDRTILKVCNAAYYAGYDGVIVANLFPYRATHAHEVYDCYYLDNPDYSSTMRKNDEIIQEICKNSDVVFAWGTNTINKKHFAAEYDAQIEHIRGIVVNESTGTMVLNTDLSSKKYYLHGLRWSDDTLLKMCSFGQKETN